MTSRKEEEFFSEESMRDSDREDVRGQRTEKWFSTIPSILEKTPQY